MEHYVTLFDAAFLPQGLALHRSMERHAGSYTLWIMCVDAAALDALTALQLPNVRAFAVADMETPALLGVKPTRTRGEYCWTLTPFAPGAVFDRDASVERVTYLDADTWFVQSAAPVFAELERSGKSVLITEHAYAPEFEQSHLSGKYCVQFVTFVRGASDVVRLWWAERCIEWCFNRSEDGKMGDQQYLSEWPVRFGDRVHVLAKPELVQGPWNLTRFPPSDAAVFHFHGLRLLRDGNVLLTTRYPVPAGAREMLYEPYLHDLAVAHALLRKVGHVVRPQLDRSLFMQRLVLARQSLGAAWQRIRRSRTGRLPGDAQAG